MACVALGLALSGWTQAAEEPTVRVALADRAAVLQLVAREFRCAIDTNALNAPVPPEAPWSQATLRATEAGILVNEQFFLTDQLVCRAQTGMLTVNRIPVSGTLQIWRHGASADGKVTAVETLPLEHYLRGVLVGEVQESWPIEALRAQAVAARSYAMAQFFHRTDPNRWFDLVADTNDQMYRPGFTAPPPIVEAVRSTRGEIVTIGTTVLKAYYHSHCGGRTTTATAVWGPKAPGGFTAVSDPYCKRTPHQSWETHIPLATLEQRFQAAGYITPGIRDLEFERTPGEERIRAVTVQTDAPALTLDANTFRRIVGFQELKSTWLEAKRKGQQWRFRGRGYGHGVGLCQWGAKGMADSGRSYREILDFYYPGTQVKRSY